MTRVEAFFLPVEGEGRFCLIHRPASAAHSVGAILFVPAFGEEMNKSRRMAALQSRAFADAGWTVLQLDLYGCGDSAGDFADATWERWLRDVEAAIDWLRADTGREPVLWGLRAGCLLLADSIGRTQSAADLILWHPSLSGKQLLQQFLRLKLVNQLLGDSGGARSAPQALRDQLARGEAIEIAGYALSPGLARGMETSEFRVPANARRVAWLELGSVGNDELSPAARVRVDEARRAGAHVSTRVVSGPQFWQTVEIEECRALIAGTLDIVREWRA